MRRAASISACRRYRYNLTRRWTSAQPMLVACMLNSSTADAERDDATIRALIHFATAWGYGGIEVINLHAWRTSQPKDLRAAQADGIDTIGGFNPQFWERALLTAHAGRNEILVAWGNNAQPADVTRFLDFLPAWVKLICLGTTLSGAPIHPASRGQHRIPRNQQPIPYERGTTA